MTNQEQRSASMERIANAHNDILLTRDVCMLTHRSVPCLHKWLKCGDVIPDYAKPFRLHPGQRPWYWSKKAVLRWIEEAKGEVA